jgi:hypothetical protein
MKFKTNSIFDAAQKILSESKLTEDKNAEIAKLKSAGEDLAKKLNLKISKKAYSSDYDSEDTPEIYWDILLPGPAGKKVDSDDLPLFIVVGYDYDDKKNILVSFDFDSNRISSIESIPIAKVNSGTIAKLTKYVEKY